MSDEKNNPKRSFEGWADSIFRKKTGLPIRANSEGLIEDRKTVPSSYPIEPIFMREPQHLDQKSMSPRVFPLHANSSLPGSPWKPSLTHDRMSSPTLMSHDLRISSPVGDRANRQDIEHLYELTLLRLALLDAQSRRTTPLNMWDKGVVDELVNVSQNLITEHPNTRFVSIGNSPSYVVYGIDKLSQKSGAPVETAYVPFSGRYVTPLPFQMEDASVYMVNMYSSTYEAVQENRQTYQKLLGSLGLSPKQIVDQFSESGKKTAIIDNMQSGTSFASFIHFVHDWAKETGVEKDTLSKALTCVALVVNPTPPTFGVLDDTGILSVDLDRVYISENLRLALNGNMSINTDRFVPHYPAEKWARPPVEVESKNIEKIQPIRDMIERSVGERYSLEVGRHASDNAHILSSHTLPGASSNTNASQAEHYETVSRNNPSMELPYLKRALRPR